MTRESKNKILAVLLCTFYCPDRQDFVQPMHQTGPHGDLMQGKSFATPIIYLYLQPEEQFRLIARPKTVQQLLKKLDLGLCDALISRDGQLLTHDRAIAAGDTIYVRLVTSRG